MSGCSVTNVSIYTRYASIPQTHKDKLRTTRNSERTYESKWIKIQYTKTRSIPTHIYQPVTRHMEKCFIYNSYKKGIKHPRANSTRNQRPAEDNLKSLSRGVWRRQGGGAWSVHRGSGREVGAHSP